MIRTILYDDVTKKSFDSTNAMFNYYFQTFGQTSKEDELILRNGEDSTIWFVFTNTAGKVEPYKPEVPKEDWNKEHRCFISYKAKFDDILYNEIFCSLNDAIECLTEDWLSDFYGEIRFVRDNRTDNGKSFFIKIRNYNGETFFLKDIYFVVD